MPSIDGGSVVYTLDAEVAPSASRNIDNFNRKIDDVGDSARRADNQASASFANIAKGVLAFAGIASVVDVVKNATLGAVTAFGDFEQNLNILRTVTGATGSEISRLSDLAVQLGKDVSLPGVSAADAAQAMTELGKAGLAVNDILDASKGVLQAAKAGNIGVADSAKIVSNALLAFNLSGKDATKVADLFAGAANASNAEILDLGLGLQQTSASANSLKVPLSDTITALAGLANAGIEASDAGTSLKTFFASLTPNSAAAVTAMQKLGISFFDAKGNFVGLRESIRLLEDSTKGLTQEQKQLAIETIFGSDASRAAIVLANQGVASFDKLGSAIGRQGVAADVAAARTSGIKGSLEALKSAVDTTLLGVGQFISGGLKPLIDAAAGNLPMALGLIAGALVGIGVAAAVATPGVAGFAASVGAAVVAAAPFIAIGAAIGGALVILQQNFDIFGKLAVGVAPIIKELTNGFTAFFAAINGEGVTSNGFVGFMEKLGVVVKDVGTFFRLLFETFTGGSLAIGLGEERLKGFAGVLQVVQDIFEQVASFVGGTFKDIFNDLGGIFKQLSESLKPLFDPIVKFFQDNREIIIGALKAIGIALAAITFGPIIVAVGVFVGVLKALSVVLGFINDNFKTIRTIVVTILAVAFGPLIITIKVLVGWFNIVTQAATAFVQGLVAAFSIVSGAVIGAFTTIGEVVQGAFTAISQAYNATLKPVVDGIIFIVTAFARIWFAVWSGIAEVVFTVLSTVAQIIGVILVGIFNFINTSFLQPLTRLFVDGFTALVNFISTVFNGISSIIVGVFSSISATLAPIINSIVGFFSQRFNDLRNIVLVVFNGVRDFLTGVWVGIRNTLSPIVNEIVNVFISRFNDARNGVSNALNGIKNLVGGFVSAGRDMINGLVRGIEGGKDAVVNKIKDICSSALDSVKKFFGIKSPSKVMDQMGQFLMEGFTNGIETAGKSTIAAVGNISNSLTGQIDSFNGTLGNGFQATVATNMQTSSPVPQQNGTTINQYNNVYDQVDFDKVSRDLAWRVTI